MSRPSFCPHQPACAIGTPRWFCGRRTQIEAAIRKGTITEADGARLLHLWKVPLTPASKVYTGQPPRDEKKLW